MSLFEAIERGIIIKPEVYYHYTNNLTNTFNDK